MNLELDLETEEEGSALNITPMIDIVFQLILFLLIATSISEEMSQENSAVEEQKIELALPDSDAGGKADDQPEVLIINIDEKGSYVVKGRSLTRRDLRELLFQVADRNPRTPVSIRGHKEVPLQFVVDAMSDCHRVKLRNLDIRVTRERVPRSGKGEDPLEVRRGSGD